MYMDDPFAIPTGTPEADDPFANFAPPFPIPSGALKDSQRSDRFFLQDPTSDQHAAPHWTRVSAAPKDPLTLPGGIHIHPTYITTLAEVQVEESRKGVREWLVGVFGRGEKNSGAQNTVTLPNGRVAAEEKEQAVPGLSEGVVIKADSPDGLLEKAKELFPGMPMEEIGGVVLVRADCRSVLEDMKNEAAPYTPPKLQ